MKTKFTILGMLLFSLTISAHDIIVTIDSERIESKVEEVSSEQIKYRKISNITGPLFVMPTSEIMIIIYENGEIQIFNKPSEKKEVKDKSITRENETINNITEEEEKPSAFTGYLELAGVVGKEVTKAITGYNTTLNPTIGGPEFHGVFGGKLGELAFLGGGIGVNIAFGNATDQYGQKMSIKAVNIPIYINSRVYIPIRSDVVRPTTELSIGLCVPALVEMRYKSEYIRQRGELAAFFRIGMGIEIKRFVLGAGYELWGNKVDCDHYAYFKLGVRLGRL